MQGKRQLERPNSIAEHRPRDGLHEERIRHMRQGCGELAHLRVFPLATREIAHQVRQETQQQDQHDERYREVLHRDIRIVANEEPCGRHTEDELHY